MKKLKLIIQNIEKILEVLTMILLTSMVLIIGFQIFNRYLLGTTPKWSEALSLLFMIWFSFIGMALGVEKGIHLSIEYFVDKLNKRNKKIIYIINDVLIAIFGIVITINGWDLSVMASKSIMPSLGLPRTYMYIIMPICGVMITIYSILNIFKTKRFKKNIEIKKN